MRGFIVCLILIGLVDLLLAQDTTGACQNIDCKNGRCKNVDSTTFVCNCFNGWFGKFCDTRTSPCASFGCTAEQCEPSGSTCKCKPGWTGADCKTKAVATLSISPTQASYPVGSSVTFACTTTATGAAYTWTLVKNGNGDGSRGTTTPSTSFSKTLSQAGTFTYVCNAAVSGGSIITSNSVSVTVVAAVATLAISPSQASYTTGTTVTFTCSTNAPAAAFTWVLNKNGNTDGSNGGTSPSTTFNKILTQVGSFTYACSAAYSGNILTSNTLSVTVVGTPLPNNPCPPNKCNTGKCVIKFGNKGICDCSKTGFTGEFCQIKGTGACAISVTCQNGATCTDNNGNWKCNCKPGFSGSFCEKVSNPCTIGCNNGQCGGIQPTCICNAGWEGEFCTKAQTNICNGLNCNNGKCRVSGSQAVCDCNIGWVGARCDQKVATALQSNPAGSTFVRYTTIQFTCSTNAPGAPYTWQLKENGAPDGSTFVTASANTYTFSRQMTASGSFAYTCTSSSTGYPNQASNALSFTITAGSSKCAGKDCNNGNCVEKGGVAFCVCDDGWWGADCNIRDICFSNPKICRNGGTCNRQAGDPGFTCSCERGFVGIYCQNMQVGAPCATDRNCDVGYMNCPPGERGYCKVPEMQCQCVVDPITKCTCHADCHTICKSGFGLCMKDGECNCFDTKEQLLFDAIACRFPFSPPNGPFVQKNIELGLDPSS